MKLNLGAGGRPLPGFANLDMVTGWRFEDGLPYPDRTVEAVTISHALMYVPVVDWPAVFADLARVLAPGGVIRVTEDSTVDPLSERYGGHPDAVALTTPALVACHLAEAGLTVHQVTPSTTRFHDRSLIQAWHGDPPKVFHVEASRAPA